MTEYNPDVWVLFKVKRHKLYKVLAGWYGGYAGSNSWRINSGITKMTEDDCFYYFTGHTGSVYKCPKVSERMSMLTASIWQQIADKSILISPQKLKKALEQ